MGYTKENATRQGGVGNNQKTKQDDFNRVQRVVQFIFATFKNELIAAVVVLAIIAFVQGGGL